MTFIPQTYILEVSHTTRHTTRLDKAIASQCPSLSRSRIKNLILKGHVKVEEGIVLDPAKKVSPGQKIQVTLPEPEEGTPQAQKLPLTIVYEDEDIIVIDKAAGMVVHPAPGNRESTLVNALLAHCQGSLSGIGGIKRPGIVHRLDKETSGLLVAAKNDNAHQKLASQFASRSLSRKYYALVWGIPHPMSALIEGNIGRSPRNRKKMTLLRQGGKPARTHYHLLQSFQTLAALIECKLESGRTHQIRVHIASQGHPIIGDSLYGRVPSSVNPHWLKQIKNFGATPGRHALHAYQLEFIHPRTNINLIFDSKIPDDMNNLLKILELITKKF